MMKEFKIKSTISLIICAMLASSCLFGCTDSNSGEMISDVEHLIQMPKPDSDSDKTDTADSDGNAVKATDGDTVLVEVPDDGATNASGGQADGQKPDHSQEMSEETAWNLILVNPWNSLPDDFEVKLVDLKNGQKVDERIYPDLQNMMDDMRAEGLSPYICSSYRTMEKQQSLYTRQITQYLDKGYSQADAEAEASKWVAVPGTSEHHTGLALDIVASYHIVLDESQEDTPEQQWLINNSWKYGFILRYPNGKTDITGIYYEPWHYRYVGKTVAKEIFEADVTLEEYLLNRH